MRTSRNSIMLQESTVHPEEIGCKLPRHYSPLRQFRNPCYAPVTIMIGKPHNKVKLLIANIDLSISYEDDPHQTVGVGIEGLFR